VDLWLVVSFKRLRVVLMLVVFNQAVKVVMWTFGLLFCSSA
jgi:hypothetical protein